MIEFKTLKDRARGCLIGGAAGDALGYPVEFISASRMKAEYGPMGITELVSDFGTGTALISDDTQMTLFTANGLLLAEAHPGERPVEGWIYTAYLDWLHTQRPRTRLGEKRCWLNALAELNVLRAPGNTCLSALTSGEMGSTDEPINASKGCGGVMRVAPVAIYGRVKGWDSAKTTRLGGEAAAATHGHSLGWLSGAALVSIIYHELEGLSPEDAVYAAMEELDRLYADNPWAQELTNGMQRAIDLAHDSLRTDLQCLNLLGQGWVGDEALYVAVYCAVKYADDFDRALIVSVNHDGDSDSTGAITGNILGASLGYEAMNQKWKKTLELRETILEMADDLCAAPEERDARWMEKYNR